MIQNKTRIALLLGDPAGVGPELISKLLNEEITKKLDEFKKKVKSKYEIISVFSNKDLLKVKKLLIKHVS